MSKFKAYDEFLNEDFMSDIFKSAHGAIDKKNTEPLSYYIGRPHFPKQEEVDAAVEFMKIDPDYLFFNRGDRMHPIIYWKGPVFYGFFGGGLNLEMLKMTHADESLARHEKMFNDYLKAGNYESFFARVDKKILIPTFIDMYDEIPDNKKYDVFTDLYVRSEYGFQTFPIEIIKDCFNKRKLSKDWKKRMSDLKKEIKLNTDGTVTIYRGSNMESAKADDAFSWTLSEKTAKFFADRFSKGTGRIDHKNIDPSEIIDYLQDRGESEVILFPKKFGKINEDYEHRHAKRNERYTDLLLLRAAGITARFLIYPDKIIVKTNRHSQQIEWFTIDSSVKFITNTSATESSVIDKLEDLFDAIDPKKGTEGEVLAKRLEELMKNHLFSKWWNKFSGHHTGKHYGI